MTIFCLMQFSSFYQMYSPCLIYICMWGRNGPSHDILKNLNIYNILSLNIYLSKRLIKKTCCLAVADYVYIQHVSTNTSFHNIKLIILIYQKKSIHINY